MNDDEIAIRKEINNSAGGFNNVGEVVERVRLIHLLSYPVEKIMYDKSSARDKLKHAIESIIPCFGSNTKLQTFDHFLRKKLTEYHGFTRISRRDEFSRKKNYYIISDGTTEHDIFKEWCSSLYDALPKS